MLQGPALAVAMLFGPGLVAQQFVVDIAGGPGGQFTDLQAAIATVPEGATLLVRPGTYPSFTIDDKSLTVLADPGVVVSGIFSVSIRNLAPHRTVAIRGVVLRGVSTTGQLVCTDCDGTVVIDSCGGHAIGGGRLAFVRCDDARVTGCALQPISASALVCRDSHVVVSRSVFVGAFVSPTVELTTSTAELADVDISGTSGALGMAPIELVASDLRLLGTRPVSALPALGQPGGPPIDGTGNVRIDPTVPLSGPVGAQLHVTTQSMPFVAARTAALGGAATAALTGPSTGIGALFVSLPGPLLAVPALRDPLLLLAAGAQLRALGPLTAPLVSSYAVPAQTTLLGSCITWQGASLDAVGGLQVGSSVTYLHW